MKISDLIPTNTVTPGGDADLDKWPLARQVSGFTMNAPVIVPKKIRFSEYLALLDARAKNSNADS